MEDVTRINVQHRHNKHITRSYLSLIEPADETLLHEVISRKRPHSKNYEDSWGYIIQATRYNGCKWYHPATDSLIFFGRKSLTDHTLVIVTFFAKPQYLANVIKIVQNELRAPRTIIKNVPSELINEFLVLGFRTYNEYEGWFEESRFDDQTYPQQIIDLAKVIGKKGKVYKRLRNALNKKPPLTLRPYTASDKGALVKILQSKDQLSSMSYKKNRGAYLISHEMYLNAPVDKYTVTKTSTGKILGFTATSPISSQDTALVAAIFSPGCSIESIWGVYQTACLQYNKGYKRINLGGSETEGTYNFMRRTFRPVKKLQRTHLIYNP
jgi:hypothetical protein